MRSKTRNSVVVVIAIAMVGAAVFVWISSHEQFDPENSEAPVSSSVESALDVETELAKRDQAAELTNTAIQAQEMVSYTPVGSGQLRSIRLPNGEVQNANVNFNGADIPDALLEKLLSGTTQTQTRFDTEPVDPDWAPGMVAALHSVVSAINSDVMEVTEIECRTSICRAVVSQRDPFQPADEAAGRAQFERARSLLEESFRPILSEPNSRLKGLTVAVRPSAQGLTTVISLVGPPPDSGDED